MSLLQVVILGVLAAIVAAQNQVVEPVVNLGYATFRGRYNSAYNINLFRRIPFAAPPTGKYRFGAPKPPLQLQGIQDSDKSHPGCPQGVDGGAEDCLYLGLYSRPWSNGTALRPVMVFFHGGGNIRGKSSLGIPPLGYPTLDVNPRNDFILVYPSFRLNVFGFLPGKKVKEDKNSSLNAGLLDQEFALKWVQKHISKYVPNGW
jgi:carboxylesterase type B